MSEDLSIGDWYKEANPEAMKSFSEAKLLFVMQGNAGGAFDTWARAELARRRDERISELITSLTDATNKVHQEVAILNSSSDGLERLTRRLNGLTWVLIVLTFFAVVVPIGLEIWNAYHS
jgi:hypothetical protein